MPQETVPAPIPGKVIKVNVSAGGQVKEGESICEIESMKMENPILAPVSGTVSQINIAPEQVVKTGETLVVIDF
ncbi:MAG: biotin/lipoyl-binding protein [Chloroflexi bacterium]|jgi:glutaconyl-CoA/methylmalonyl-CoA decarboxylase subunit gamma|nr:biotin/lipoyl-binding protein [Chloroflexota bacterium]